MSATSSPSRRTAEEEARKTQPHQEAEDAADTADLQKDERALFDLMYERLKPKFLAQVLELFPDDEALQTVRYRNALETAKRRIPRRMQAEVNFHGIKAPVATVSRNLEDIFTDANGVITDEVRARAQLEIDRWEKELQEEFLEAVKVLKAVYYGLVKEEDPVAKEAEKLRTRLNLSLIHI